MSGIIIIRGDQDNEVFWTGASWVHSLISEQLQSRIGDNSLRVTSLLRDCTHPNFQYCVWKDLTADEWKIILDALEGILDDEIRMGLMRSNRPQYYQVFLAHISDLLV